MDLGKEIKRTVTGGTMIKNVLLRIFWFGFQVLVTPVAFLYCAFLGGLFGVRLLWHSTIFKEEL